MLLIEVDSPCLSGEPESKGSEDGESDDQE